MKARELAERLMKEPEVEVYIERSNGQLVKLARVRPTYVRPDKPNESSLADGRERSLIVSG